MNDGQKPRRSIFGLILPYIVMALAVGLFIWLIASNLNRPNTWYASALDSNLGYVYNTTSNKYEFDTSKQEYKIKSYQVSQGYKAVTISGTAQNKSNQTVNFNTTIEEDRWNQNFVTTVTVKDGDGNKVVYYDVEHLSYATIFSSHEVLADGASYYVTDAFEATFWDTWGPTILTIGVTVLLGAFFFFRLSSSVNGANRQVMDFNKSPARRENQTKVRFADVAGCDAEKAEMVELVEYLKDPKK